MDTSKTYIKMCDCEEIQGLKFYRVAKYKQDLYTKGDWFYWNDPKAHPTSGVEQSFDDGWSKEFWEFPSGSIWLPTQDQLQEMAKSYHREHESNPFECDDFELVELFYNYWWIDNDDLNVPTSMEQLWLAFRMKEVSNKTWDGNNWIKE